ncbi:hypothetical protein [Stenomitos frigidus]|uniref:Uncharacterized protein n=1 Tax=Stenomitos frigidus ULC18 TaxID=2107698 RepID=A0A2T1E0D9_9CYAN|nr:hypothetical protein [Stenomitos frigidus]PSB26200.1 hypothetical protein C7B82_20485 [Stenomitos frigidus ULC18]
MLELSQEDVLWIGVALLALSGIQVSQSLLALGLCAPIAVPLAVVAGSVGMITWALGIFDGDDLDL